MTNIVFVFAVSPCNGLAASVFANAPAQGNFGRRAYFSPAKEQKGLRVVDLPQLVAGIAVSHAQAPRDAPRKVIPRFLSDQHPHLNNLCKCTPRGHVAGQLKVKGGQPGLVHRRIPAVPLTPVRLNLIRDRIDGVYLRHKAA